MLPLASTVGFPRESMMYLPFTAVTADMLRANMGRAARAVELEMEASMAVATVREGLNITEEGTGAVLNGNAKCTSLSELWEQQFSLARRTWRFHRSSS